MEKVPMIVTGLDVEYQIDVLIEYDDLEDGRNPTGRRGASLLFPCQVDSHQLRHMNTLLVGLRQDDSYLRSEFPIIHERNDKLLTVVNRNITHMMRILVHRI